MFCLPVAESSVPGRRSAWRYSPLAAVMVSLPLRCYNFHNGWESDAYEFRNGRLGCVTNPMKQLDVAALKSGSPLQVPSASNFLRDTSWNCVPIFRMGSFFIHGHQVDNSGNIVQYLPKQKFESIKWLVFKWRCSDFCKFLDREYFSFPGFAIWKWNAWLLKETQSRFKYRYDV